MLQKFDERNKNIQVFIKDKLYPREEAKISVFDSVVQGGDAVWEGLRVYSEGLFCLDRHLERLQASAKAIAINDVPNNDFIKDAIFQTLKANDMQNDTHIRLTLTRGEKITSGMDPRLNQSGPCLIVLAEWKPPVYDNDHGITVITSSIRRNNPNFLDSKIHHNNLLNNILAKIQANVAGVDSAMMLDEHGYAAELNGTNVFLVKNNILYTPHADSCLHGITRGLIIELARDNDIQVVEKNLSMTEFYTADEVFGTGTMGELTPIVRIDGRDTSKDEYKILTLLKKCFQESRSKLCTPFS